jgi:hypothetical protein
MLKAWAALGEASATGLRTGAKCGLRHQ